ncbi:MAG: ATP-binding protein, partial [Planctomycetota bacterium]
QNITLNLSGEKDPAFVKVDGGQIQQVLTNLIVNAMQAMPRGGDVEVGIQRNQAAPPSVHGDSKGDYLCIYVRDQGEGIPEESIHHIFDPFFTTKEVGQGTGLGLSIAYGIVRENGGWIDVKSEPGKGSLFSVFLPQENKKCTAKS